MTPSVASDRAWGCAGDNLGAARPDGARQRSDFSRFPGRLSLPASSRTAPRLALASPNEHGDGNPIQNIIPGGRLT